MKNPVSKVNLVWAVIWTVMFVSCVVGFFWNPSHFFTAIISAAFAIMFWHDYDKTKNV